MIRGSRAAVAGACLLWLVGAAGAQVPRVENRAARVDSIFAPWDNSNSPGCVLGVSKSGELVYERGYGMASLEHGLAITPLTAFHVASITKQFTATAILLLVQRGQLSLDDPLRKFVTEFSPVTSAVTLRHLMTHTSGLRGSYALSSLAEPPALLNDPFRGRFERNEGFQLLAGQRALDATPGSEFRYDNGGFGLLGLVVKRVSGQSLRTFLDSNIFAPLGMTHTHLHDDPSMIIPNRASGYYGDATGFHVDANAWRLSEGDMIGNTGLYTTARDLLIWEQNFAYPRVGDPRLLAAMQTPTVLTNGDTSFYGFGLNVGRYRGTRAIGHVGDDPGFFASVIRYPEQGVAIAVLCNATGSMDPAVLSRNVANLFLENLLPAPESPVRSSATLSGVQRAAYAGLYRHHATEALARVVVRDGELYWIQGAATSGGSALDVAADNRFRIRGRATLLEFGDAAAGQMQDMRMLIGSRVPVTYRREREFTPTPAQLREFSGQYSSVDLNTVYTIAASDSGLTVTVRGRPTFLVRPLFPDAFYANRPGLMKFVRDTRGRLTGLTISADGARNLPFERVRDGTR